MNWEAIGAIGEILGAAGVIVSVTYLAIQIRQNTRGIEVAARQTRGDAARDVLRPLSDGRIAPIMATFSYAEGGFADYGLANQEDNVRLDAWCHQWMRTEEHDFGALTGEALKTDGHPI